MRQLSSKNNLQSIDLSQAQIVTNSTYAYYQDYKTSANVLGDYTFYNLNKLVSVVMPQNITKIGSWAFSSTGLKIVEIPDKVTSVGGDAFSYCDNLNTVIIGNGVKSLAQGVFYSSNVKDVYVKPLAPPTISGYLFTSKPTIHVYKSALDKYKASAWAEYGTIVGDLTDEIIDGIWGIKNEKLKIKNDEAVFDLMGRRVTTLQPGTIYIQNGKKILAQ